MKREKDRKEAKQVGGNFSYLAGPFTRAYVPHCGLRVAAISNNSVRFAAVPPRALARCIKTTLADTRPKG